MTRPLPHTLAPLVEDLELDGVRVTTRADLVARAERLGINDAKIAIHRLAEHGWLLKTGVQGAWEFAPGAHAGPYPHGDPFLVLRAQLAVTPKLPARIALFSALWRLGVADRAPNRHQVSLPPRSSAPKAVRDTFEISRIAPVLDPVMVDGLPVNSRATTLVHLAESPSSVRSWGAVLELLPDLLASTDSADVVAEIKARPAATKVRLAYLVESIAPELVEAIGVEPGPLVWFGKRGAHQRYDSRWNIADTALPRHPSER